LTWTSAKFGTVGGDVGAVLRVGRLDLQPHRAATVGLRNQHGLARQAQGGRGREVGEVGVNVRGVDGPLVGEVLDLAVGAGNPPQRPGIENAAVAVALACVGTAHAFVVRHEILGRILQLRPVHLDTDPERKALERIDRRAYARGILETDPLLAYELRIGRPDMVRTVGIACLAATTVESRKTIRTVGARDVHDPMALV